MTLSQNFTTLPPDVTAGFTFSFITGTCIAKTSGLALSGTITGQCGDAYGSGTTNNGHTFTVDWVGTELVFSGEVTGTFAVAPVLPDNCVTGADRFIVSGTVVKSHTSFPTDLCVGEFRMTVSSPFAWRASPPTTASFTIQMTTGTCTQKSNLTITGSITGMCIAASGTGTSNNGFSTSLFGSLVGVLSFTGGIAGSVVVDDNVLAPGDCTTGTATEFTLRGALTKP